MGNGRLLDDKYDIHDFVFLTGHSQNLPYVQMGSDFFN